MNAKYAKAIRQVLRAEGINIRDAQYDTINHKPMLITVGINQDGTPKQVPVPVTQQVLKPSCGRSAYKQEKRVFTRLCDAL